MNRRTLVLIGLLFQTAAVFGLFVPNAYHHAMGTIITLQTVPVDPMSIFRGEYVTLDYEIGQAQEKDEQQWGRIVYLTLESGTGGMFHRVAASYEEPTLSDGQVCLRGRETGWGRIEFPEIGQYFVEQGLGKELEGLRNAHQLIADVSVYKCSGLITGLRIGPEAQMPEPTDPFGEMLPPVRVQQ